MTAQMKNGSPKQTADLTSIVRLCARSALDSTALIIKMFLKIACLQTSESRVTILPQLIDTLIRQTRVSSRRVR